MARQRNSAVIEAIPEQTQMELAPAQVVQRVLADHEGYQAAIQNQRSVETARARLQAEYDQILSQTSNPDLESLAQRIVAGDDIATETTELVSRRDAVRLQLQAHNLACTRAQQEVQRQRELAATVVSEALRPIHRQAVRDLLKSFDDLAVAHERMVQLRTIVNGCGMSLGKEFVFFGCDRNQHLLHQIASDRQEHWNNWVSQHLEG